MKTATLVQVFKNNVWIETDLMGSAHVMVQSTTPDSCAECIATVHYAYPYIDNLTRDTVATRIAEMFDASSPVEIRHRAPA